MAEFVTEAGIRSLLLNVFNGVNTRIGERIVTTIDATSDVNHVPSAKTVYDSIKSMITFQTVVGTISDVVTEPKENVLYFQKDTADDTVYSQYIYENNNFVCVSPATDANITEVSNDKITEIFNQVFAETAPTLTGTD